MATQSGAFVVFGFTGTDGIAATGLTGNILLQSHSFEHTHDEVQIKGATGNLVTRVLYNEGSKATLEVIATGSSVANARTAKTTLLALKDTIINITACADAPELVLSNWLVVGTSASGSNTDAHKVTLNLEAHAGITSSPA